jgi:hypothetical protein
MEPMKATTLLLIVYFVIDNNGYIEMTKMFKIAKWESCNSLSYESDDFTDS